MTSSFDSFFCCPLGLAKPFGLMIDGSLDINDFGEINDGSLLVILGGKLLFPLVDFWFMSSKVARLSVVRRLGEKGRSLSRCIT